MPASNQDGKCADGSSGMSGPRSGLSRIDPIRPCSTRGWGQRVGNGFECCLLAGSVFWAKKHPSGGHKLLITHRHAHTHARTRTHTHTHTHTHTQTHTDKIYNE